MHHFWSGLVWNHGSRDTLAGHPRFRWVLILTQATTILVTWPVWQIRTAPPMLPAVSWLQLDMGPLLLISLAMICVAPRCGMLVHTALVVWAMGLDQMRMQPPIISQVLLLWSTLPGRSAVTIGRVHLLALWFYAGAYKLLSPYYVQGDPQWLLRSLYPSATDGMCLAFAWMVICAELGLAFGAWFRRTRFVAGPAAFAVHLGILFSLSPMGINWDPAVWAWNFALALSGLVLIQGWETRLLDDLRGGPAWLTAVAAVLLLAPLGYSFGVVDTCFCHLLYSNHVPQARIHTADGSVTLIDTRPQLNVPVPQIPRLLRAHFQAVGGPADRLEVWDPRWWYRHRGLEFVWFTHATAEPTSRRPIFTGQPQLRALTH